MDLKERIIEAIRAEITSADFLSSLADKVIEVVGESASLSSARMSESETEAPHLRGYRNTDAPPDVELKF